MSTDADPTPPLTDEEMNTIINRLVAEFHPRRLIIFGDYARGDWHSACDLDLLVEMDTNLAPALRAVALREALWPAPCSLDLRVYTPAEIEQRKESLASMIPVILEEGRVVYAKPRAPGAAHAATSEDSGPQDPASRFATWVACGDEDAAAIRLLLAGPGTPWAAVGFHAYQAAEKYLKALIVSRGQRADRSHEISRVLDQAVSLEPALAKLHPDCAALSFHTVDSCYPDLPATKAEKHAQEAVAAAERDLRGGAPAAAGRLSRGRPP